MLGGGRVAETCIRVGGGDSGQGQDGTVGGLGLGKQWISRAGLCHLLSPFPDLLALNTAVHAFNLAGSDPS